MKRALLIALVATPILLAMSYPGREAHSGTLYLFSLIGWLGFMLSILTVLVLSIAMVVRKVRRMSVVPRNSGHPRKD